jgi:hypothetical protein
MPDVAAAARTPVAFHPVSTSEGGSCVVAGDPYITSAVPAVKARYPYPVWMFAWYDWDHLNGARRGRANADDDLGAGERSAGSEGAGQKNETEGGRDLFLHDVSAPDEECLVLVFTDAERGMKLRCR